MGFLVSVSIGWLLEEEEDNLTWWELQQDEVINKFLAHFIDDGTIIGFVDEEVPMRSINSTEKLRNSKRIKTLANSPHFEGRISIDLKVMSEPDFWLMIVIGREMSKTQL